MLFKSIMIHWKHDDYNEKQISQNLAMDYKQLILTPPYWKQMDSPYCDVYTML